MKVGVLGAGVMGAGIAQVAAINGCDVRLLDISEAQVRKALDAVAGRLERAVTRGTLAAGERDQALSRLAPGGAEEIAACELIIEAVPEILSVNTAVLGPIVRAASPQTLFASNTSSLSITLLGESLGIGPRLAGMHFFNPAPVMPLVEVIAGRETEPGVVDRVAEVARGWGKTVVRAKDTPGFIVNRVARGYYLGALRMLGEGIAGVDEIDQALRERGGFRLGPFELMDLVGIDVNYSVSTSVWEQLGRPARLAPHPLQRALFDRGQLGRKTRRGFYDYAQEPPAPGVQAERKPVQLPAEVDEAVRRFVERATEKSGHGVESYIFARVLVSVINEAALVLDGGVATK